MTLNPIECNIICESINSIPVLKLEVAIEYNNEDWKYIKENAVIKCKAPWNNNKQLFRINKIEKDLDSIIATAYPIFYDAVNTYVKDTTNDDVMIVDTGNVNGQQALDKILSGTKYKGHSNIVKVNRARYDKKNIIQALNGDIDNCFTKVWGGEIYLDNYDIYINESIGHDNGVTIEYGKNLMGLKEEIEMSNIVTRIIPIGYDGLRLEGKTPWVDSSNIYRYYDVFEREVVFDKVKVKTENDAEGFNTIEEARQELIRLSKLMFTEERIDVPRVSLDVEFVDLSKTLEYKDISTLEEVGQGDIIKARHTKLGIDTNIRCIGYDYNVIEEAYNNLKLGQVQYDYFKNENDKWNNVNSNIDNIFNNIDGINGRVDDITDNEGNIIAEKVKGFLDATKTKIKAQRQIGQLQDQRAFIWEDLNRESPTYGCMVGGSAGIQISQQRTPDGKDWDFSSAFTAEGIVADKIVGNLFSSKDGSTSINMNNGEFRSKQADGSQIVISPQNGFYNQFGTSKKEYYHLNTVIKGRETMNFNNYKKTINIQLPNEFKGKNFIVIPTIATIWANSLPKILLTYSIDIGNTDYTNGSFDIYLKLFGYDTKWIDSLDGYVLCGQTTNWEYTVDYNIIVIA